MDTAQFDRWQTPVSDAESLGLVRLVDDGALNIYLNDLRDPNATIYQFTFFDVAYYRNIPAEFQSELSELFEQIGPQVGWTLTVPDSLLITELTKAEPMFRLMVEQPTHYLIRTEREMIDVICEDMPQIVVAEA